MDTKGTCYMRYTFFSRAKAHTPSILPIYSDTLALSVTWFMLLRTKDTFSEGQTKIKEKVLLCATLQIGKYQYVKFDTNY